MVTSPDEIKKTVILYSKSDGTSRPIVATISLPEPSQEYPGDYVCYVEIESLLEPKKKLFGVDAFQVTLSAIRFIDTILSKVRSDFEIHEMRGGKYISCN